MPNLIVRGYLDAQPEQSSLEKRVSGVKLTPKYSGRPARDRAGAPRQELDKAAPDDIVELELEDGFKIWTRVEDLQKEFEPPVAARGEAAPEEGEIPLFLEPAGGSRGLKGRFAIKAFRVLGVDLEGAATWAAKTYAKRRVEEKLELGLHRCTALSPKSFEAPRPSKADAPTLLFLHGTASSTEGSFGGLWASDSPRIRSLIDRYDGQVLAFEHRTLSESPIENALEVAGKLAKLIKPGAPVHLVSHSRGGLVGELLCRSLMVGRGSFTADEIKRFEDLGRKDDAEALEELGKLLDKSPLKIERFVRVACPARGTTLASKRIDRYLSIILSAIGKIPWLAASNAYDMAAELLLGVLKKKASPEDFPGLEAMMPTSPLVALLNDPRYRTEADLHVLGGDLEGGGVWGRLKELATNLFYLEDHDLVVNTPSMFGGAPRSGAVHYWIDTGANVNHFNYFSRDDTASRLVEGLLRAEPGPYRMQDKAPHEIEQGDYQKRALNLIPRQTVVILPGIMGTQLKLGDNRIWVSLLDLAGGGLSKIARGTKVETDGLVADAYKKLVSFLAETHDVELYPYDWRKTIPDIVTSPSEKPKRKQLEDLFDKAAGLRERLEQILARTEKGKLPVRILAHSMGGLVVRAMLATDAGQETWNKIKQRPGSRFIMLGTPNGGSHGIAALLLGRDSLVRKLALLDFSKSHEELLSVISGFDGVLQLLPHGGSLDCYDPAVWDRLYDHDVPPGKRGIFSSDVATEKSAKLDWAKPDKDLLAAARDVRDAIRKSPIEPEHMIYVAGRAPQTASDIKIVADNEPGRQVVVLATARGDGRVPWATGIPAGLEGSTYYMEASHGDLANSERDFPALLDLLERGVTTKLSRTAPSTRAASDEPFELREENIETYPTRGDLIGLAMAGTMWERERAVAERVRVRVVHGNLSRARKDAPVMVGHYKGDTIVSAEAYIDRQLCGRLSELHRLDLYPGPLETSLVELNDGPGAGSSHPGAIVVGLGQVGDLSPGGLANTVSNGLRRYGAEMLAKDPVCGGEKQAAVRKLRATLLLIGTGSGGLSLADSLQSILRGVNLANQKLNARAAGRRACIAEIDVVELYEDRAIQALKSLLDLGMVGEFRETLNIQETLEEGRDGRYRAYFEEDNAWWQRIRIHTVEEGVYKGALRFEAVTNRARADTFLRPTQQELVNGFLERARKEPTSDRDLSGTLFELLIPNAFKQYAPDRRNLALIVDEDSAKYPWELLHDRFDETARPLAVEAGMIRVLVTKDGRSAPIPANDNRALVIGDPPTKYNRLPGAAEEARKVAARLAAEGVTVTPLIGDEASPQAVVSALYAQKYRIVHIAAHGIYEPPADPDCERKPAKAGVVLDGGILLTPAEFDQMRFVPELVFLNCCHLGQMAGAGDQPDKVDHRFAANVATQFIRMGVRAVIAAGWEVDDVAATTFAEVFYSRMLKGAEFGEAVKTARDEVYREFGRTNTWGAYQCYGDPGFRLGKPEGGTRTSPAPGSSTELRLALENIAADAASAWGEHEKQLRQDLEALVKVASQPWLERADIMGAVGEAYGQLGCYEPAIRWFEQSLPCESARQRLRVLERLVNFRARLAEAIHSGSVKAEDVNLTADALIADAEKLSDILQDIGKTAERWSIRGSLYKRAAMVAAGASRRTRLERMAEAYAESLTIARGREARDVYYPLQNWYAAQIALDWTRTDRQRAAVSAEEKKLIDGAAAELNKRADEIGDDDSSFWDLAQKADILLLDALRNGKLDAQERAILEAYRRVMRRGGSRRERLSVLKNLRFFQTVAEGARDKAQVAETLERIREELGSDE